MIVREQILTLGLCLVLLHPCLRGWCCHYYGRLHSLGAGSALLRRFCLAQSCTNAFVSLSLIMFYFNTIHFKCMLNPNSLFLSSPLRPWRHHKIIPKKGASNTPDICKTVWNLASQNQTGQPLEWGRRRFPSFTSPRRFRQVRGPASSPQQSSYPLVLHRTLSQLDEVFPAPSTCHACGQLSTIS